MLKCNKVSDIILENAKGRCEVAKGDSKTVKLSDESKDALDEMHRETLIPRTKILDLAIEEYKKNRNKKARGNPQE